MNKIVAPDCVLVVESDLIVRQPLAEYLRECGYRVYEAIDTDEATQILNDRPRAIDIILCDVDCPGELGGFGLSRWVRTQGLPAKVILAASVERAAQKAGDLCEDGPQVRKPYDHALLLDRIKRMLAMRERSGQP
jgi:CheY-like chemotaxis protein